MNKLKLILKPIIFTLIFLLLFSYFSERLCRKSLWGAWNHTVKTNGFFNEPENEFDLMYFGSSNTYCSFNPLVVYEETGIKSYVLATQQQPVWASYTYIKEALKTQTPKLIVLDILMFAKDTLYYDDGVNHAFMDDLPLSKNKIELAQVSAEKGSRFELVVNLMKYHTRWSELTEEDYQFKRSEMRDYLKGYVLLEDTFADAQKPNTADVFGTARLLNKSVLYFDKIVALCEEKNIPLLLVKTPSNSSPEDQKLFNSISELANKNNLPLIDYNQLYTEIGLVMNTDFYDKSHLNYKGAEKFTRYFSRDVMRLFALPPSSNTNNTDAQWQKDLEEYKDYLITLEEKEPA